MSAEGVQPGLQDAAENVESRGRPWRYAFLLAAALLVSAGEPLLAQLAARRDLFDVGVSLLILAVLFFLFGHRVHLRIAMPLAIAASGSLWAGHLVEGSAKTWLLVVSHLLTATLFVFGLSRIVRSVLVGSATTDAMLGALCGYLLLGIIWGLVDMALETAAPGSFQTSSVSGTSTRATPDRETIGYFSFITLATVGYGDVTPVSRLARTLAWMEAVAGQFYLAVLVAGLVGFRVARIERGKREDRAGASGE